MTTIVGLLVVFGAVLGGYAMAGGPFGVLIQPNEIVVIAGAAIGTVIISSPGGALKRISHALKKAFTGKPPVRADYLELLRCMYSLFQVMRRDGVLALEQHVSDPDKSSLFQKFPAVLKDHHAV